MISISTAKCRLRPLAIFATVMLVGACGGHGGGGGATSVALQSISVTPGTFSTGVGITRQLTATGHFSDGSTSDLTASATWTSLTPAVVTVSGGAVTGAALGAATLQVSSAGVAANIAVNVTANVWSPAASMLQMLGPLTLLQDGRVLSAGGSNVHGGNAEIYDPLKDNWSAASPLALIGNTLTLLNSGQVLSAEGADVLGESGISSLYDPASNSWSGGANMIYSRQGHTATLLTDGSVLVAGGVNVPSATVRQEERYNAAANSWPLVPGMASSRTWHTATLLSTGNVLVAGGYVQGASATLNDMLASAEIFEPTSNTWSPAASMATARDEHAATLLPGGKVLVAGGQDSTLAFEPLSSAEIYDPVANTWSSAGNMASARVEPASVLLPSGKVLVIGGSATSDPYGQVTGTGTMSAEVYDPGTNTWAATGTMTIASGGTAAVLLKNGTVLACGFISTSIPGCELYW